jgi:tetratricopeptide (TPR) repeat protein
MPISELDFPTEEAPTTDVATSFPEAAEGIDDNRRRRQGRREERPRTLDGEIEKAERAFGGGSMDRAQALVERAIDEFEGAAANTRVILLQVRLARHKGDNEAAAKAVWALTERSQTDHKAAFSLAQLAADRHAPVEQIGWLEIALKLEPNHEPSLIQLGRTYRRLGKQERAYEALRRAAEIRPPSIPAHMILAEMLQEDGRFDEAAEVYRTVLSVNPGNPMALAGLISTRKAEGDAVVIDHADLAATSMETPWPQRVTLRKALAKYYDRAKNYEQAYIQAAGANELLRSRHPHDAAAEQRRTETIVRNLQAFIDLELEPAQAAVRPVFVIGMPRSGTTLVEQILSAHPDVDGLGELPFWPKLAERWRIDQDDFTMPNVDEAVAEARRYRELLKSRGAEHGVAIDKLPDNYRFVSLIAALLPDAYFVHNVRDPRDNLISIFFEHFAPNVTYVTAVEDIVARRKAHDAITEQWHRTYPDRMLRLTYEDFVRGGEASMRALVEAVGLEWTDAMNDYRTVSRSVRTPSKHQVREALYDSSIGRWRNYEPWMRSAFDALGT